MTRHGHVLLPPVVLTVQVLGYATLRHLYLAGFGPDRSLPDDAHLPTALLWLAAFGLIGTLTALAATYALLRRARWWLAAPLVALLCVPALLTSLASLYVFAGCRGWI